MATFQCQACGNLHGAPVAQCGTCGSPAVMLVPDDTPSPPAPLPASTFGAPPPPPPAAAAAASTDEFLKAFGPLFEEGFDYVRARDRERVSREAELDASETQRRDALNNAKIDLFTYSTTLVRKVTELAESAITYVDTVLLQAKQNPPQS